MRILHYALGFAPYRSGGLTKYVTDLMLEQLRQGDWAGLLWPGSYSLIRRDSFIREGKAKSGIDSYELKNPLPVPLMDGIQDVPGYTKKGNKEMYRAFFEKIRPDVFHVHTLMGLHRECLEAAKELRIPIVYTAHDYFPVCPKVTLFRDGKVCKGMGEACVGCNQGALPFWKIVLLQSGVYRRLKDTHAVRKARGSHKRLQMERQITEEKRISGAAASDYERLARYYRDCLSCVSCMHYGSRLTRKQYEKCGIKLPDRILPVTHGGIRDRRKKRTPHQTIQFAFLADLSLYKGFGVLCEALDELWKAGERGFVLHIYSENKVDRPYLICHPPYRYEEVEQVLEETDMVLVPSLWEETFGLVVLEALSHGVPVLVSEHVGARELVEVSGSPGGIVTVPDKGHIEEAVRRICDDPGILEEFNRNICQGNFSYDLCTHCREIRELYDQLQKEK